MAWRRGCLCTPRARRGTSPQTPGPHSQDCQPQGASPIGCCLAEAKLQIKGSGPSGEICFGAFWCSREVTVFLAPGAALGPFRAASPRPLGARCTGGVTPPQRREPGGCRPHSPRAVAALGSPAPPPRARSAGHAQPPTTANAGAGSCVKRAGTAPRGASAVHRRAPCGVPCRALVGRTMPPPVLSLCRAVACAHAKRGRGGGSRRQDPRPHVCQTCDRDGAAELHVHR